MQYATRDYAAVVSCAEENGYAERVFHAIKEEEVALNEYSDYEIWANAVKGTSLTTSTCASAFIHRSAI